MPMYDRLTLLRAMIAFNSASASCSLAGAGRSSGLRRRMYAGIASFTSASSESAPTARSISLTSAGLGPRCREAKLGADVVSIIVWAEQFIQIARLAHLDLEHPTFAVRVVVQQFGCAAKFLIHGDDITGHGRVDVAGCLDAFHHGTLLAGFDALARARPLHVHDIGQTMLSWVGD